MKKTILGIITTLTLVACSSEPKTFDDCILKYMQGTNERGAVGAIYEACQNKFPESKQP